MQCKLKAQYQFFKLSSDIRDKKASPAPILSLDCNKKAGELYILELTHYKSSLASVLHKGIFALINFYTLS